MQCFCKSSNKLLQNKLFRECLHLYAICCFSFCVSEEYLELEKLFDICKQVIVVVLDY